MNCCIPLGLPLPSAVQLSFTSVKISSIHFLSAGVNAAERSNFGSRNSKTPVSIFIYLSVIKDYKRASTICTLTSRSISACCVIIEFVHPQSQLGVFLIISICCNGRYGWKNASYNEIYKVQILAANTKETTYLAKYIKRKPHEGHHALVIGGL